MTNGVFTPEQDNKTNVEPVHSYDVFHAVVAGPGVKGIIGMHRFNICLVVVLSLSCSGVKTPYHTELYYFLPEPRYLRDHSRTSTGVSDAFQE